MGKRLHTHYAVSMILLVMVVIMPVAAAAQVRVAEKPVPPREMMKIPPKPGDNYVLLPGRWVWHRPARMYAWLAPVWVEPPRGKVWIPGYWKEVRKGWLWVPGKWENRKRFWSRF